MESSEKTRLLIGSLAAAIVLVIGYGLYQSQGRSESHISSLLAPAQSVMTGTQTAAASAQPVMHITSETPVSANTAGHAASVTGDPGLDYEWSIKGGVIEGDARGSSITWTAGEGREVILYCKGTATGKEGTTAFRAAVKPLPSVSRFEAVPEIITDGDAAKLSWAITDAQKVILDPGGQDVSKYNGPALEMKPPETTTYKLTATNSLGAEITRELQLKVVPKPELMSLRSEPVPGSYTTFTVIGEFRGSKAELKNGSAVIASSEASPLRAQVADLKEGSSLTLLIYNEAGSYVSCALTFSSKAP
jgi:hypothetical protein